MKVLICPSAYKGTLSSSQVAAAIAEGIRRGYPLCKIVMAPVADGGDGTIDSLSNALQRPCETVAVRGPLNGHAEAKWLMLDDEHAVVELASACGLGYLNDRQLKALDAHTIGLGEVVRAALAHGAKKISLCVGGSASTDGGSGMLRALGAGLFSASGDPIPLGGGGLAQLDSIDLTEIISEGFGRDILIEVVADVRSPLLGEDGAATVFGAQKGASPADIEVLELGLKHFADLLEPLTGRERRNVAGAGAAGGTAFGAMCALGAELVPGFAWLAAILDLEELVSRADVVITAEGSLDQQSVVGKATGELGAMCMKYDKKLIALPAVAQADIDWQQYGISMVQPVAQSHWIADAEQLKQVASTLLL